MWYQLASELGNYDRTSKRYGRSPRIPAIDLQEQYEDLAAQQLDLRAIMDQKHQEFRDDMDRRQTELIQMVSALKNSFDGMQFHQQPIDCGSILTDRAHTTIAGQGILGPNIYYVSNKRNPNLVFPRFNGENLKISCIKLNNILLWIILL